MTIVNTAKAKLEAGEVALGVGLRNARTVDVAPAMATAGYDWLFIDMEHNTMHVDTAAQISVAALGAGIAPLVRVPGFAAHHASRVLDGGALGVVVPHVDDVATAAEVVAACRFPPIGRRSVTGALPQLGFRAVAPATATPLLEAATLVVVMLETPAAIEAAPAIAAVPGVDALLVGSNDLAMALGIPGEVDDPRIAAAMERVVAACRDAGKHPGMGGVYAPPLMRRYIDTGVRLVLAGNDHGFLMSGATAQLRALREQA
jgi:2-keto-3-deoxy-L-rhamnonate aldolase RhmA